jgi:hypothetical protein
MAGMHEVIADLGPRLEAAARDVSDASEARELAIAARNALVVRAVEEGMTQKAAARFAGVSAPYVTKMLLEAEPAMVIPRG